MDAREADIAKLPLKEILARVAANMIDALQAAGLRHQRDKETARGRWHVGSKVTQAAMMNTIFLNTCSNRAMQVNQCYRSFYEATGNSALATATCGV